MRQHKVWFQMSPVAGRRTVAQKKLAGGYGIWLRLTETSRARLLSTPLKLDATGGVYHRHPPGRCCRSFRCRDTFHTSPQFRHRQ